MATPPPFTSSTTPTNYSASTNHSPNRQHTRSRTADHKNTTPTTEEYDDDDDRDTLEYQLQHRENHISKLASDLQKLQSYTLQYQRDIHTLRRQQLESSFRHRVSTKLWRRTNEGLSARCACYQNELTSEAAREIANLIRDAAPPNKDSTYLMMLQDQLNKATLKLSHLSNQTEIILSKGEEVIESLRTEMNEVIRERCKMELELLDNIHGMEEDMKRMVNRTERRLKRVQGEIDFLEKNAVEVLKSKEVDDDEEEHEDDDDDSEEDDDAANDVEEDKSEEEDREAKVGDEDGKNGEKGSTLESRELMTDANDVGAGASAEDGVGDQQVKEECGKTEVAEGDKACKDKNMSHNDKVGVKDNQQQQQQQQKDERHKQHTPENLRSELRKLATDRDATLSILQKKLREKNEEFQTLLKSKKSREETINKLESVRRDREEWERSREDGISSTI
jgi:hypothetical protein